MIDTLNRFMVGWHGGGIVILNVSALQKRISGDEALLLAAHLVAMAEPLASHKFSEVLEAVQNA